MAQGFRYKVSRHEKKTNRTYVMTPIPVPEDQRSPFPAAPCFKCGVRGHCKHSEER